MTYTYRATQAGFINDKDHVGKIAPLGYINEGDKVVMVEPKEKLLGGCSWLEDYSKQATPSELYLPKVLEVKPKHPQVPEYPPISDPHMQAQLDTLRQAEGLAPNASTEEEDVGEPSDDAGGSDPASPSEEVQDAASDNGDEPEGTGNQDVFA